MGPPIDDCVAVAGIPFVLKSGIPWAVLPEDIGCGSDMTCRRGLRDWRADDVRDRLHEELSKRRRAADQSDWSLAAVDSSSARAVGGGETTGPDLTHRVSRGVNFNC